MKHIRNSALILAIPLMAVSAFLNVGQGAPTVTGVSGSATKGGTLTLSGSGFGTKASARPIVWDDFESGSVGATIHGRTPVVGPAWATYISAGSARPSYTNLILRSGSTKCSLHDFTSYTGYNSSLQVDTTQPRYYFTFWYYYDLTGSAWSRNVKPWVMYGSATDQPIAYCGWGSPTAGDGGLRSGIIDNNDSVNLPTLWASGNDLSVDEGRWIRIEGYMVQSTAGQYDGAYQMWVHKPHQSVSLVMSDTTARTRVSSGYWRQLHIGSYDDSGSGHAARIYVDDVYVDSTQARVELGDAGQWAACTWREVQLATAWSASSVSITLNPGQHAGGEVVYLYVVDANGAVNTNGFAITLGGTVTPPDTQPPAAPSNLRVVQG